MMELWYEAAWVGRLREKQFPKRFLRARKMDRIEFAVIVNMSADHTLHHVMNIPTVKSDRH